MAELLLSSVVDSITGHLVSLISQEIGLAWGVKVELEKLRSTVSAIVALLREAEKRQVKSEVVKDWLEKLKDVIYDADDLLDDYSTEALRCRIGGKRILNEVCIFFSSSNQLVYASKMAHRVKEIRERIDVITDDRVRFQLEENSTLQSLVENRVRPETYPFEYEPYVIGRDEDKRKVIEFLLNPDFEENVSILPIVGFGGLGKTTLARLVFNDEERVKEHFELKLWVCVSTNFDVNAILKKILRECTPNENLVDLNMTESLKKLGERLDGKKFLLVLDDVWNENRHEWLNVQGYLMRGAKGSKVLVTTRSPLVAKTMTTSFHKLSGLPEEESLSLLMRMAMKQDNEWKNYNIEKTANEILKKCAGVPLAIITIGRLLLFTDNTEEDWLNFRNNELSRINQEEGDIMPSLKLSYDFLPTHLKQCFDYCSLFPKDYELEPSGLIHLWMAQQFIKPNGNKQTVEEVGQKYFMELVHRSFFQDIQHDMYGNIESCKMHDLMHDLAESVARGNCVTIRSSHGKEVQETTEEQETTPRHVSMFDLEDYEFRGFQRYKRIRSLILFVEYARRIEVPILDVSCFRNLRALRLGHRGLREISSSIGKLKHLRSLDLSRNWSLRVLPNSITKLCNLETLNLRGCESLERLPRGITKLVNLRQLDVSECYQLNYMPRGIGRLKSLQMLGAFVVGDKGNSDAASLNELGRLTGLKKRLSIRHLERLGGISSELDASLSMEKLALQSLLLRWDCTTREHRTKDEEVLERLRPYPDLKGLIIQGFCGATLSSWVFQLSGLVEIEIWKCRLCKHLPPLDQLPSLKRILLAFMDNLEWIELSEGGTPESFFPSLKEIGLYHLHKFKGWERRRMRRGNRIEEEEEDCQGQVKEEEEIPSFSPKIHMETSGCPRFSHYMQEGQRLHLGLQGTTSNHALQKLMMNNGDGDGDGECHSSLPPTTNSTNQSSFTTMTFVSSISLPTLTSLTIEGAEDAEHFPVGFFHSLLSLRSLEIRNCPRLITLPMRAILRYLTALERLDISGCEDLGLSIYDDGDEGVQDDPQLQGHSTLGRLHISGIPKMETLPEWIQHLTNLESLFVAVCDNLKALPEWFPGQLTSLKSLYMDNCGEMSRRCKRNSGEDWPKISHIPNLHIY